MRDQRAEALPEGAEGDRPLSVLIALETSGGGSGRHALDLAEGLDRLGHGVAVLYSPLRAEVGFLKRLEALPVVKIDVPMARAIGLKDFAAFRELQRAISEYGPFDVLHAHSSKAGALIRALPTSSAKIYTPHAFRTMDPGASLVKALFVRGIEAALGHLATDRIIAVSTAEAKHACDILRLPSRKVTRIVNGVDTPLLRPRDEVRSELGLSSHNVLVGFVGRLARQKNPELYLRAMAKVCGTHPHARGLMLGDGNLQGNMHALREQLGLQEHVAIVSGRAATDYFAGMDCLAMTSRYEAMPYVLLEALASGLPIVCTPVGGSHEAVLHQVTGYVTEPDEADFVAALGRVVGDELLRRRMASSAADLARQYSIEQMVKKTCEAYKTAIGERVSASASHNAANAA